MKFGQVEIPESLVKSLQENKVIVFAGAGVSMGEPANLPDFKVLTRQILNLKLDEKVEYPDQKLGEGFDQGVKIHEQCTRILQQGSPQPTQLHHDILRLFPRKPKVITTNFDLLFEDAFQHIRPDANVDTYRAPVFPLGSNIEGIIYLHGNITEPRSMVLSDADFGRAYLSESWAKRLLTDAFLNYDFIFIGYSYNDTILKYLTRSLPKNRTSKLYAFANIEEGNIQQVNHWQSLGIEPLIYQKENGLHQQLPKAVHDLAQFLQYDIEDHEQVFKKKIQEYEKNNSDDALNYIKFLLSSDNYKTFYTVSKADVWLIKIKDDQTLFDVLMKHEWEFFRWIAGYLERYISESMDLLQKYPILKKHQNLLWQIFRKLDDTQDKNCYRKWFVFLEKELYSNNNLHNGVHSWVLEKLNNFDLLQEFKRALQAYLNISIHPKQEFNFEKYELEKLFKSVKPKEQISLIVLNIIFEKLEEYFEFQELFGDVNNLYSFSKQEIWEKSDYGEELGFYLVDGSLVLFSEANLDQNFKNQYASKCLNAGNILLKRLGVYLLSQFSSYDADFIYSLINLKIDWLEIDYRAEFFKFLEVHYQNLSTPRRVEIINKINNYQDFNNYSRLKFFAWILKFTPDCELAIYEYEKLKALMPNFQLDDQPYLSIRYSGAFLVSYYSPFSIEEIQKRTDYIWYLALLEYDFENRFSGPNRLSYEGLWDEIVNASTSWLLDFLDFTLEVTPEHPIVSRIINKSKNWEFDLELHEKFYQLCLKIVSFNYGKQIYAISHFLDELHEVPYYQNDLEKYAKWVELAIQLIAINNYNESTISGNIDVFTEALNSVNGALAGFVIKLYGQAKDNPQGLCCINLSLTAYSTI